MAIDWEAKLKRANELTGSAAPDNEEILDLEDLVKIEEREDTYHDRTTGKETKRINFYYVFSDKTRRIPPGLHKDIATLKTEMGHRLHEVKILKTGEKLNTRYKVIPHKVL